MTKLPSASPAKYAATPTVTAYTSTPTTRESCFTQTTW